MQNIDLSPFHSLEVYTPLLLGLLPLLLLLAAVPAPEEATHARGSWPRVRRALEELPKLLSASARSARAAV